MFDKKFQKKCYSCTHYHGYHFTGEALDRAVYCGVEKCHHEYRSGHIRPKDPMYVEAGKIAAKNRKMYDAMEQAIVLCKELALAEKLTELGEGKLKQQVEMEFESAAAFFIVFKRRKNRNVVEMASHFETYLLAEYTNCGDWNHQIEAVMPHYPRRFWLWLWINFAETRTKQIFKKAFQRTINHHTEGSQKENKVEPPRS